MLWATLTFGRYEGKSLPQVILHDPDYFFWGIEKGIFDKDGFREAAIILEGRACNVKIPKSKPEDWCILYHTDRNGHFAGFDIVEVAEAPQLDSIEMWQEDRLDLSVARRLKSYDKLGGKLLLRGFKYHFFGSENIRLTKQRCEEFFSDERNFTLIPGKPPKRQGERFGDHGRPSTWEELVAENRERIRQEAEQECSIISPLKQADQITTTQAGKRIWLAQMSELLGRMEQKDEKDEISDEEWEAQMKQDQEHFRAEERKSLERQAQYSWEAAERLRDFLQNEEGEKALAAWVEEDRKRQEAIAEAESSSLNILFDSSKEVDQGDA
jgi:hypothetical protein